MGFNIDPDYKEVAERLVDLFAKFPEARMRGSEKIVMAGEQCFVICRAECYRDADDQLPGVGIAWEPVPGRTSFTKDSEVQNAETSAWGRAIVAIGASTSKRIASAEDVRNAQARANHSPAPERAGKNKVQRIQARIGALGPQQNQAWERASEWNLPNPGACNPEQIDTWDALLKTLEPA